MSKKKNNSTGSLKGFILLVIIIAAALYLYQNNDTARSASLKQQVEQTVDNATQYVEKYRKMRKRTGKKILHRSWKFLFPPRNVMKSD